MRSHLLDPTASNAHLKEAIALGREIYDLYEAGQEYSASLKKLSLIAGHPIHAFSVHSAFGSVKAETFARRQIVDWHQIPNEIDEEEMLEMIDRICSGNIDELQIEYWIACLRVNTGDERVSDLIFWPGAYFGDGNDHRVMLPSEILATALSSGGIRSGD